MIRPRYFSALYRYINNIKDENPLHASVEDGNLEDLNLERAIQHAKELGDKEAERLAKILLSLSEEERVRLTDCVIDAVNDATQKRWDLQQARLKKRKSLSKRRNKRRASSKEAAIK